MKLATSLRSVLLISCCRGAVGFGVPQALLSSQALSNGAILGSSTFHDTSFSSVFATSAKSSASAATHLSPLFLIADEGGAMDIIRNIAVAITAVLFLLAGITLVTASILIPAAAKELEKECLELAPELWDEYQAKLEPGQTIDKRPELMQELGEKLQPMLDAKIARAQGGVNTTPSNTGQWDDTGASFVDAEVVDVEVVKDDRDEKDS